MIMGAGEVVIAVLAAANLLGVSGLYFRLGAAITTADHLSRRQDLHSRSLETAMQRLTKLETITHEGNY